MTRPSLPIAIVVLLCAQIPNIAIASLTAPTRIECGAGEYVVGLNGRTGAWIDALGPVCARWDDRKFQAAPGRRTRIVGGPGGGNNPLACPAGSAISGWRSESILVDQAAFADRVTVQCQTLAPPNDPTETRVVAGQNSLPRGRGGPRTGRCPAGTLASAVDVWLSHDGRFVTDVAMKCSRAPSVGGRMTSRRNADASTTYFSPELKVRTGDRIQLDWCRAWAVDCGQPAADAFCKTVGQVRASSFTAKPNVGLTVIVSDRRICNSPACTGFAQLTCGR